MSKINNNKTKNNTKKIYFKSWKDFCTKFEVSEGNGNRVITLSNKKIQKYIVHSDTKKTISSIDRTAEHAGIPLGEENKKGFKPSLWALDMAFETKKHKTMQLDKKSAWLFLCGRDIFASSLDEKPEKGFIFPVNEKEENLGIGYFDGKMILNLLDKGDFLRREG